MSLNLLENQESKRCGEIRMDLKDRELYCLCDYCGTRSSDFDLFKVHMKMHNGADCVSLSTLKENQIPYNTYSYDKIGTQKIPTIKEETTSELANVHTSGDRSSEEANYDEEERDQLITFIALVEKWPVLWNPALLKLGESKELAIQEAVQTMQRKFGHIEWSSDLIVEEVKNLFLLWLRIEKGSIERPWFAKYLNFFEVLNEHECLQILKSFEVTAYEEIEECNYDIGYPNTQSSGESSTLNVVNQQTPITIQYPLANQDSGDCVDQQNIIEYIVPSPIELSECTTDQQIECFIELFKKKQVLWKWQHPQYLHKSETILACNELASEMSRHFRGTKFWPKAMLRGARDLIKMYSGMQENTMPKLWFYEKLAFLATYKNDDRSEIAEKESKDLNELTEDSRQSGDSKSVINYSEQQDSLLSTAKAKKLNFAIPKRTVIKKKKSRTPLSWQSTMRLIELYRNRSPLWKKSHDDYYNFGQRMQHYREIAKTLNHELRLSLTAKEVQNKIYSLIVNYRRNSMPPDVHKLLKFLPKSRKRIFNCQYCELQFATRKKWIRHEYSHVHSTPRVNKIVKSRETKLLKSMSNPAKPIPKLRSWQKQRESRSLSENQREQCSELEMKSKRYTCSTCDTRYATRAQLEVHKREHSGEKPHRCTVCGMSFYTLSSKIKHGLCHAKVVRPNICKQCHESFDTLTLLKRHMQQHVVKRLHYCGECGKQFLSRTCLKIHTKIHRTNRLYKLKHKAFPKNIK